MFAQLVLHAGGGVQGHQRYAEFLRQALPARAPGLGLVGIGLEQFEVVGVQFQLRVALGKAQQAGGGQGMVEGIGDWQQQQVGVPGQQAELLLGAI